MRKSKTRRRVAVKTAAIAAVGAGVLFGAMPAIASISAAPKAVNYKCMLGGTGSADLPYSFQMDLTGPLASPTPNGPVVATWKIGTPAPAITASASIPATGRLIVEADTVLVGTPLPSPSESRVVDATAAAASATAGQPLTPPPMLITVTPTAAGAVTIQPGGFTMYLNGGTGAGTSDVELIDCVVATPAEVTAAALVINVQAPGAATTTPPVGATTTPPVTPPTTPPVSVSPTVTVTQTKTSEPVSTRQIDETPAGAASTGGGGAAGPDARLIMLSGALMVAFAGIGGLVLRRRTATRN